MHTTTDSWRSEQREHSLARAVDALTDQDRLASGPARLDAFSSAAEDLERAIRHEVTLARRLGISWAEIGASLNVSKQAAQQRYGAEC